MSKLEEIEKRRAERKKAAEDAANAQKATDLEAIDALEQAHGDANIAVLEVPHTDGMPVLLAVRTPKPNEIKRFRDTVKTKRDGSPGDNLGASQALAAVCLVYPDKDTYAKVLEARPGVDAQLGLLAVHLAAGKAEEEGKG